SCTCVMHDDLQEPAPLRERIPQIDHNWIRPLRGNPLGRRRRDDGLADAASGVHLPAQAVERYAARQDVEAADDGVATASIWRSRSFTTLSP
ncbi:hypothetical protein, partial [Streptomyces sp. NPDC051776]|uniref:hypothetical protein n=1 Tax=Streptomyces sp. NPDC051776 TaxID=3155414 RepID=UPI003428837F